MNIEQMHNGIRYTLSNDNLKVGDETFPIAHGRCLGGDKWVIHNFDFRDFCSGFPDDPHIIKNLKYSEDKAYEVQTNKGYSPRECYYKIIKKEKREEKTIKLLTYRDWVEIT